MPRKPLKPCSVPGCSVLVERGRCEKHSRRPSTRPAAETRAAWYEQARRMYDSARWRFGWQPQLLAEQPLCASCKADGRVTPATVADHIRPHRGDPELFWDWSNLQGLCEACHNRKSRQEAASTPKGVGG